MKGKEVKALRDDELAIELGKLQSKLFELRSQKVTGKVEDTSLFSKIRRDIARVHTERRARVGAKKA